MLLLFIQFFLLFHQSSIYFLNFVLFLLFQKIIVFIKFFQTKRARKFIKTRISSLFLYLQFSFMNKKTLIGWTTLLYFFTGILADLQTGLFLITLINILTDFYFLAFKYFISLLSFFYSSNFMIIDFIDCLNLFVYLFKAMFHIFNFLTILLSLLINWIYLIFYFV